MSSDEDPLFEPPRPEDSGPACPRCRSPMEAGYLVLHAIASNTLNQFVTWNDPSVNDDRPGEKTSDLWTSTLGGRAWLKGYRCSECEFLELGYGRSGLTRDGWRKTPSATR